MNFLTQMKISTRLMLGFGFLLLLGIVGTVFSIVSDSDNTNATHEMMSKPLVKERLISDWYVYTYSAVARTSLIARSTDNTLSETFKEAINSSVQKVSDIGKQLEPMLTTPEEKQLFQEIADARAKYQAAKVQVMKTKTEGDAETSVRIYDQVFEPAANAYRGKVLSLLEYERKQIDETEIGIEQQNRNSTRLSIVLSIVMVALGAAVAVLISRSITVPMAHAVQVAKRVASGDLTGNIEVDSQGETGELLHALRDMNQNLAHTIAQVHVATDTITTAAHEIAAGNADLSARTESQASSLQETAASMEQLTGTVRQNADHARHANQLVISASEVASQGGEVVSQVVNTMGSIKESSARIVDIISVIDGIAFQTNILALNAAVEAARAGEQGRGFAVVATEVRNLAQRSANAAKEIKSLIADSVDKVEHGGKLVDKAGQTMDEIVRSVRHVADIMAEITSASQEQSAGIEQVNLAVTQMDEMTQQNSALVEQAAAAAASMQEQAGALVAAVSVFRIAAVNEQTAAANPGLTVINGVTVRAARTEPMQDNVRWQKRA